MKQSTKLLLIALGWLFVVLGTIGTVIPLVPTTPLYILAAFCFSKGSDRLHNWILSRPVFGPLIVEWEQHGVIRRRAKVSSTIMIIALFSLTLIFVDVHLAVKLVLCLIAVGVLTFIWTRPSVILSSITSQDDELRPR